MVLGSRRRLVTALVTAGAAIALALVASGRGCAPADATPEGAVQAFVEAARDGNKDAAWALLGPATRRRLEDAAVSATEKAGGPRRFAAKDMFEVDATDTTWAPTAYRVKRRDGDRADVEVVGPAGKVDVVQVVKVDGRWRVELGTVLTY